jgi:hypothetical protein
MNKGEFLYPLPSVQAFVSENLNVYWMDKDGKPNCDIQSTIGMLASNWVNIISKDDDVLLSELIYWKNRGL